ncbi:MAG TPA: ribosomal protein S18-alanine N-acetyltransferase [Mycobacteriales bacterium]|jgi:ribosomal-protein-alanine N-acetyltransferase|nr:ribosomal protein S18-alanine N-acetyltransferase [Mycobacteriales bacterium]
MRELRWWDLPAVMELEHELFGDEAWSEGMFWSELAERDTRRYVVEEDESGAVCGYAGLCAYAPHEAYVQTMAVAPAMRRRGLGEAMLLELMAEATRRGCPRVDLEVRADNDPAIRLYERNGFVQIGVRRGYYQPSGTDALVMRREFAGRRDPSRTGDREDG